MKTLINLRVRMISPLHVNMKNVYFFLVSNKIPKAKEML